MEKVLNGMSLGSRTIALVDSLDRRPRERKCQGNLSKPRPGFIANARRHLLLPLSSPSRFYIIGLYIRVSANKWRFGPGIIFIFTFILFLFTGSLTRHFFIFKNFIVTFSGDFYFNNRFILHSAKTLEWMS